MIPALRVKEGVQFAVIAPGGFVLLSAFWHATQTLGYDLTITSGTDGTHSGESDPHHSGRAYDLRTKGLDAQVILSTVMDELLHNSVDKVVAVSGGGYVTDYFFGWLEDAGGANEHLHFQVRRGTEYPPTTGAVVTT